MQCSFIIPCRPSTFLAQTLPRAISSCRWSSSSSSTKARGDSSDSPVYAIRQVGLEAGVVYQINSVLNPYMHTNTKSSIQFIPCFLISTNIVQTWSAARSGTSNRRRQRRRRRGRARHGQVATRGSGAEPPPPRAVHSTCCKTPPLAFVTGPDHSEVACGLALVVFPSRVRRVFHVKSRVSLRFDLFYFSSFFAIVYNTFAVCFSSSDWAGNRSTLAYKRKDD
jgi:hypothetical protein